MLSLTCCPENEICEDETNSGFVVFYLSKFTHLFLKV